MIRSIWIKITLLCIGLCTGLNAQVLYEISGNGVKNKSYLLATYPRVDAAFLDTIPSVFKVYGKCDKVITEFTMADHEVLSVLRRTALLPDSVRIESLFGQSEIEEIDGALFRILGVGLSQLGRMKPSYMTEMVRNQLYKKELGWDDQHTMETFFQQVARQNEWPIYGLDDMGETLYMQFDREPLIEQCRDLKKVLFQSKKELEQEKTLCHLYRNGRLTDLAYQIESPDNSTSFGYSDYQVYCQRNKVWVQRLSQYLRDGKAFIVLNATYLGGDKGLIVLLRKEGYRVVAVNRGMNRT